MSENKLNKFGAEFLLKSINPNGKSVEEEREEAVKHVFLRHYGVGDILIKHGKTVKEMMRTYDKAHGYFPEKH